MPKYRTREELLRAVAETMVIARCGGPLDNVASKKAHEQLVEGQMKELVSAMSHENVRFLETPR